MIRTVLRALLTLLTACGLFVAPTIAFSASAVPASATAVTSAQLEQAETSAARLDRCKKIWLGTSLRPATAYNPDQNRRYAHAQYRINDRELSGCFFVTCLQIYIDGEWTGFTKGTDRGYCLRNQATMAEPLVESYGWAVPACSNLRYERIRSTTRPQDGVGWRSSESKDLCD